MFNLYERVRWRDILIGFAVMPPCHCDHPVLEADLDCHYHGGDA